MANQYFLIENGQQQGPFTKENLIQLEIKPETMVWSEGFDDWKKAKDIDDLKSLFLIATPPPFSQAKSVTPPPYIAAEKGFIERNKLMLFVAVGVIVVGALLLVGLNSGDETEPVADDNIVQEQEQDQTNGSNEGSSNPEMQPGASQPQQAPPNQQKERQLSEGEMRERLYQTEKANPTENLSASGSYKVNLAANTIITGTIYNNASYAGFKNVKLIAKFYSKTDVVLGKESFVVMEFVDPSNNVGFTHKITGWWSDIDHWSLEVVSAEGY